MTKNEQVLVFPATRLQPYLDDELFALGIQSNSSIVRDILDDVLSPEAIAFMDRAKAELDPNYKQVIPYCVLWSKNHHGEKEVFAYRRTKKGGEDRLHEKWSLGVGGHINPGDDADLWASTYATGLRRELKEEVGLLFKSPTFVPPIVGLIYDPSNDVGKVHFGVVHLVEVPDRDALNFQDEALANGTWTGPGMRRDIFHRFENWSQLILSLIDIPS